MAQVVTLPPGAVSTLLNLWPGETYTVSAVGICAGGATTPPSPQVVFTTRSPPPKTRPPPKRACPWPATTPKCVGNVCVVAFLGVGFAKLDLQTGAVSFWAQPTTYFSILLGSSMPAVPPNATSGVTAIYSCGLAGVIAVKDSSAQHNSSLLGLSPGQSGPGLELELGTRNVSSVSCNVGAMSILFTEGSVLTLPVGVGNLGGPFGSNSGGNSSAVAAGLQGGIVALASTAGAYAALSGDGSLVVWGNETLGGSEVDVNKTTNDTIIPYSTVAANLINVSSVFSTAGAFAAVHSDGSCTTW